MHVYMCVCVCVCACVWAFWNYLKLFNFLFKEIKYIDDGRCICMSVCTYVELNWFPEKGNKKNQMN